MANVGNKEDNIEILLSTMNRTSLSFLSNMFPDQDYTNYNILIVNQTSKRKLLVSSHANIRVINSFEKGLSLSRNIALKNAKSNICLIADDDVTYVKGFKEIIVNAFGKYSLADIVTFQLVDYNNKLFKDYPNIILHDKKTVSTVNSVVIALKRKEILKNKIFFNTNFGMGSIFCTAGEYVFLRNALKGNLKIYFEPKTILKHPCFSSGQAVAKDEIVFARSAVFYKYNGMLTYLKLWWHLYLLLNSGHLKFGQIFKKYKIGLMGINKYKYLLKQGLET